MPSERTRVRRLPDRGRYEFEEIAAILDQGLLAHVATIVDESPIIVPTLYVRREDHVYIHGSPASRLLCALQTGAEGCFEVTLVDALVLARSAFHHSVNYRSVIAYGVFSIVEGSEKLEAMQALVDRAMSGRWAECRPISTKELAATTIMSLTLDEASAKVRTGDPVDDPKDLNFPIWAGTIPIEQRASEPVASHDPIVRAEAPNPKRITFRI
ncbi:MAG: pyridoxamine 5'-phosphate oxidase family protein [Actinomycetota bacterium]